jgi:hypothetical protein
MPVRPADISRNAVGMALRQFARAVGCSQRKLEAIWDVIEAIVNCDAGHGIPV